MLVTLPWPHGTLFPNRKAHWAVVRKHRAVAKKAAWGACREAGLRAGAETAVCTFEFYPPDMIRRDVDNTVAALKGAIDGIAEAIGVDDSRIRMRFPEAFGPPIKGGQIIVKIEIPA